MYCRFIMWFIMVWPR